MSKAFGIGFGAMVVILAVVIWVGFARTKGNHLVPEGTIGKVRTAKIADNLTFMVIDFYLKNDSDRDMIVRSVEAEVDQADGTPAMGSVIAAQDTLDALHNYPVLGEQYNPPIKERDIIPAHHALHLAGCLGLKPAQIIALPTAMHLDWYEHLTATQWDSLLGSAP